MGPHNRPNGRNIQRHIPSVCMLFLVHRVVCRTRLADIIYIIDMRLNDHGKNWRHVYKTLILLEYCICCGADPVVQYAQESMHVIKTLKEFQVTDEFGKDNGACVRQKCREIVAMLSDEGRLAEARANKSVPLWD